MTAGLTSRPIAGTKVPFAPQAAVILLGAVLVAGAMLGAAIFAGSNKAGAQAAADASLVSQALIQFRAGERASWASGATASQVSQALIQYRADERASWAPAAPASRAIPERDSLRLEHVTGPGGAAGTGRILQHGPLE